MGNLIDRLRPSDCVRTMLPRVLEDEVMDTAEEAGDYDAIDHREVNRRFVDDFIAAWEREPPEGEVLDLGTGTARIPIDLARHDKRWRILGVDLAQSMLDVATQNVERASLGSQIRLACVDVKSSPLQAASFAAVISNSIVHHIPRPHAVIAEAVRLVSPGGLLFFRDLLRPADRASLDELVQLYSAGAHKRQRAMFAASLHAALTLDEVRELVALHGFAPSTVQVTSDRHWTWAARVQ